MHSRDYNLLRKALEAIRFLKQTIVPPKNVMSKYAHIATSVSSLAQDFLVPDVASQRLHTLTW